jgi:predicted nucleic acid-binding protein
MIVLDTNVLSELMKSNGSPTVYEWVSKQAQMSLFTTTITEAEILYGIALLPSGKRRDALTEAAQQMFAEDFDARVLSFDTPAAIAFAQIAAELRQIGRPISQFDAQIAAICYSRNAQLATRNVTDFQGCGLSVLNPWVDH